MAAGSLACGDEEEAQCSSDAQCPGDQRCDLSGGLCFEPCSSVGASEGCTGSDVCLNDGTCAVPCDDAECVDSGQLCQSDLEDSGFNTCVDPDLVASSCPNDDGFQRDEGGPLLLGGVEFIADLGDCSDDGIINQYEATVYAPSGLPDALFTDGIEFIDPMGNLSGVYSEGPQTPSHPSAEPLVGSEFYEIDFTLCESAATPMSNLAIRVFNVDDEASNAVCF